MKFSGPLESRRLSFLLEMAVSREAQMWKEYVPKIPTNQDTAASPAQRDEVVQWLTDLNCQFRLYPETLALAISILDRFLASVKAHPKYLRCIAITCFFLSAKTNEEDERIPALKVLARNSYCGCSPAEILRMERVILQKLNWDLHTATPLHFLQIFHALAMSSCPRLLDSLLEINPSQHMAFLTRQIHQCLACHQYLQFKGSVLALAVITLEIEKLIPDWLALTIDLLKKAQIDSSQLICCRELMARNLSAIPASLPPNIVFIYSSRKQTVVPCDIGVFRYHSSVSGPGFTAAKDNSSSDTHNQITAPYQHLSAPITCKLASAKRKVEEMEVDEFYDGIKRLYNEDSAQDVMVRENMSFLYNASASRQEGNASPCPPLQPVSVL